MAGIFSFWLFGWLVGLFVAYYIHIHWYSLSICNLLQQWSQFTYTIHDVIIDDAIVDGNGDDDDDHKDDGSVVIVMKVMVMVMKKNMKKMPFGFLVGASASLSSSSVSTIHILTIPNVLQKQWKFALLYI